MRRREFVAGLGAIAAAPWLGAQEPAAPARGPDVIFVPTPDVVIDMMLTMAGVTAQDTVYDLGCGDGRIVVAAAKRYGARAVGIDIDPARIREANSNAREAGVTERTRFVLGDLFEADISPATVVTLYLLTDLNLKLRPKLLRELAPGTRVVSHAFNMGDWKPERSTKVAGTTVYLWRVPQRRS